MDVMPIGTEVATWAVKDFSVELRELIVRAAKRHNCTVAEFLHSYFQRHGLEGQQFEIVRAPAADESVKITQVEPTPTAHAELRALAQIAREATPTARDSEAMKMARRLVRERLQELGTPRAARVQALPAPAKAAP